MVLVGVKVRRYGRTQDRILSLAAGYSVHVPKPVDPGELTTIIGSVAARPPQVTWPQLVIAP